MNRETEKKGFIAWMAKNHVAANLLMFTLIISGTFVMLNIKQEVFPEYDLDIVNVSVSYPGASPEEVETGILLAMEEELRGLEGIKKINSNALEGRASISAELITGIDPNKALQDIKGAVDRISSLPEDAERPLIQLQKRRRNVMELALFGEIEERVLFYFSQRIREELLDLPQITEVEIEGVRAPEIIVEVPQSTLRSYNKTLGNIAQIIRDSAIDIPAGGVKSSSGEVLLRTSERRNFASEFGDIAIVSNSDGTKVRLEDIAQIHDSFTDSDKKAYFNGKPAVLFIIYRTGKQTPIAISQEVKEYLKTVTPRLPEGITLEIYEDKSDRYRERRDLLLKNGIMGLLLVLLTLTLFLETRLAFWVSMGIPISILGSFCLLYFLGGSINMISMFAFIITLGIVVDDAMVVGENIYYKRQQGLSPLSAAIEGAKEMAAPISVAVATNIIAFFPLLFVSGSTGSFFLILPIVVISVFILSLLECLFILPAHLSGLPKPQAVKEGRGIQGFCARGLDWFTQGIFTSLLRKTVKYRYQTTLIFLGILALMFTYFDSGRIHFSFRPRVLADRIDAEVTLPYGTPIEEVERIARYIEECGRQVVQETDGEKMTVGIFTEIGKDGSNTAEVTFNLVPQSERKITTRDFSIKWREKTGEIPGLESLFFDFLIGPGGSQAINVELSHPDSVILESAARDVSRVLTNFAGVTDINDGYAQGKPQYDFKVKPQSQSLGLDAREIGLQLRHAFHGAEALRQQRGRNEIKVMVRLPEKERKSLYELDQFLIRTKNNGELPLSQAAFIEKRRAYTEIRRIDGKRILNITANVIPEITNENQVLDSLKEEYMSEILSRYPGLKYSFEGQDRDRREAFQELNSGFLISMLAIAGMLATLFANYSQPLIVMITIPLAIGCALLGHIVMDYSLSIISVFGIIALCGVIVNGGLVLTVTANQFQAEGMSPSEAAIKAGARRFRPIFLAALTTFFGLAPMIFESSVGARFLIPMAISLGFGIMFSTPIILVLTPALYVIHRDFERFWQGKKEE